MGDLILGIILLIALLDGYRRGVIKILGSFGGIVIGVFLARRLTPEVLPWLATTLQLPIYDGASGAGVSPALAQWFYTNTALGRIVELVIFLVLTAAVTWVVRFLVNAFGSVVNATPLVGFVSRTLGAVLELFIYAAALYFIYIWFLPWLIGVVPEAKAVNSIFTSSRYVLQVILELGGLVWHTALDAVLAAGAQGAAWGPVQG